MSPSKFCNISITATILENSSGFPFEVRKSRPVVAAALQCNELSHSIKQLKQVLVRSKCNPDKFSDDLEV